MLSYIQAANDTQLDVNHANTGIQKNYRVEVPYSREKY